MIVDIFVAVLGCVLTPASLLFFILLVKKYVKFNMDSPQAQKDYYWLKIAGSNKRLEEDNCSFFYRFTRSLCFIMVTFLAFILLDGLEEHEFEMLADLCSVSSGIAMVALLVSTLVVISLVLENKKAFYMGIKVMDVVKQSSIPGGLVNFYAGIAFMLVGYVMYGVVTDEADPSVKQVVQLWVGASFVYMLANLMRIIHETIKLCLSVDRKELAVFHCFRRRIVDVIQLDGSQSVSIAAIEKITAFLLKECLKRFGLPKSKTEHLQTVNLYSIASDKHDKIFFKRQKICVDTVMLVSMIGINVWWYILLFSKPHPSWLTIVMIVSGATAVILYIYGRKKNIWLLLFHARYYYVFSFFDADSCKTSNRIARAGDVHIFPSVKRFEALALMEDLLGFYKMLLYDKRGKKYRYVVIKQVLATVDEKNAKIRNAILLLLYYSEYEKVYIKLANKQQDLCTNKLRIPDEKLVREVNREVKKKKVINYDLLNKYIDFDTVLSAEYQLADAILSEVYKEPFKKDDTIVPDELRNYKFECYFKHISKQYVQPCL